MPKVSLISEAHEPTIANPLAMVITRPTTLSNWIGDLNDYNVTVYSPPLSKCVLRVGRRVSLPKTFIAGML